MPMKYMENQEMLGVTDSWIEPGTAANRALVKRPLTRAVLAEVETSHVQLLDVTGTLDSKLAPIIVKQTAADGRHDNLVCGVLERLSSEERLAKDPAVKAGLLRLRNTLFPDGAQLVKRSYDYETGHGLIVAKQLGAAERAQLAALPTHDGTLLGAVEEYLHEAAELGRLTEERAQVADGEQPTRQDRIVARNGWIRAARMMENAVEMTAADDPEVAKVMRALRQAEQQATRRYLARAQTGEPGAGDAPAGGDIEDDNILDDTDVDAGVDDADSGS
jgi:hypothetical protein